MHRPDFDIEALRPLAADRSHPRQAVASADACVAADGAHDGRPPDLERPRADGPRPLGVVRFDASLAVVRAGRGFGAPGGRAG